MTAKLRVINSRLQPEDISGMKFMLFIVTGPLARKTEPDGN
jgi:hypothetical protein